MNMKKRKTPITNTIRIATDFSSTPGTRRRSEGPHSGEEFREEKLAPLFERVVSDGGRLLVDFDGVEGFASSFLEEAFGGLVRQFPDIDVLSYLDFKSDEDPYRKGEVEGYIKDAVEHLKSRVRENAATA